MASMNAWPSVSSKRGGSPVVSHKIVKCEWTDTLGAIVEFGSPMCNLFAQCPKILEI